MTVLDLAHRNHSWRVVVIGMLLSSSPDDQVDAVAQDLFLLWPTEHFLANALPRDLESVLRPLGHEHARSQHLRLLSARWSACGPPQAAEQLLLTQGVSKGTALAWELLPDNVWPSVSDLLTHARIAHATAKDIA